MPDDSLACKLIMERLQDLHDRMEKMEAKIDALIAERNRAAGVGAAVMCFLGGVGWVAVNGIPAWAKNLLK